MIILLILVIGLVTWSLRLLQESLRLREFSLMLAGTLVAISAAGVIIVYLLMDGCVGYLVNPPNHQSFPSELYAQTAEPVWLGPVETSPYPASRVLSVDWPLNPDTF